MPNRAAHQALVYGTDHKQTKEQWRPTVEAGEAWCAEPICHMQSRWIHPEQPWDLAHNRDTGGYRGAAHTRCNRSEGAAYGNRQRGLIKHARASRDW